MTVKKTAIPLVMKIPLWKIPLWKILLWNILLWQVFMCRPGMAAAPPQVQSGKVRYSDTATAGPLLTNCLTDHQGEHAVTECRATLSEGALFISFPAQLPAYWGTMEIRVKEGSFIAMPGGIMFGQQDLVRTVISAKLTLSRSGYAPGDKISGTCDITYSEYGHSADHGGVFNFAGTFAAVIRDENFNPLDDGNIASYDLDTALYELGEPVMSGDLACDEGVAGKDAPELFSSGSLKPDKFIQGDELTMFRRQVAGCADGPYPAGMREVTWDVGTNDFKCGKSGEHGGRGRHFITIWFKEGPGGVWGQEAFRRWGSSAN